MHTDTIGDLAEAGADIFVSGPAIFQATHYIRKYNLVKNCPAAWREAVRRFDKRLMGQRDFGSSSISGVEEIELAEW